VAVPDRGVEDGSQEGDAEAQTTQEERHPQKEHPRGQGAANDGLQVTTQQEPARREVKYDRQSRSKDRPRSAPPEACESPKMGGMAILS
jgi:hypothetical protein